MSAHLFISLLGSLRVQAHGCEIELPRSRKARAILGYLAMQDRALTRNALCEVFFADVADPRGGLRWCVSQLRQVLNGSGCEPLTPGSERIELKRGTFRTDVDRLATVLKFDCPLTSMLELERSIDGGFLDDLVLDSRTDYASWRLAQRAHCRELHMQLLRRIVRALEGTADGIEPARRLTQLDAGNEEAWAMLIAALIDAGERREARQVLQLAHEQLDQAGTRLRGFLFQVAGHLRPTGAHPPETRHPKPVLAVLPCQTTNSETVASLLPDCHHALFEAASAVKAYLLSSQSVVVEGLNAARAISAAQDSGADLLIESQLQPAGEAALLTVQLTDASTRALLCNWHVEVERERTSLRHRIVQQLSCRFELDIPIALVGVARDKPADERNAWDLYYLALPKIYSAEGYSAEDALALIDGALDLDPNIGPALCAGAWVRSTHADHNTTSADRAAAATLARRAVELCQDDAFVMGWAAICIAALDQDLETARDICQRAITFNPFSSMALIANGVVDHYLGDDAGALAWIQRAETGVDTEPLTFLSYAVRSMANFQLGNHEAAIEWGRRSVGRNPRFVLAQRSLTAALAEAGRLEEARESAQRLVELDLSEHLSFFRQRSPYKHRRATENLYRALARAGLPEQRA